MPYVTPVKHINNEHKGLELGDVIDPQFLPASFNGGQATISADKIPDLTPYVHWINTLYTDKRVVVGTNQIVIYYYGEYEATEPGGAHFDVPLTIEDDQGNTYNLATASMCASVEVTADVELPVHFEPRFSPKIYARVGVTPFVIHGTVSYIR
jgi:hypothetical protein